jgi:hypothetical protein
MPKPEERIAEFAPNWIWQGPRCIATDWAVNFAVDQGDPALRTQVIAIFLETTATAYRALAEGAANTAKIIGGKGRAQS